MSREVNEALKERIAEKIESGGLEKDDLEGFFDLFAQICNANEDIQDELDGFDQVFQFNIEEGPEVWISFDDQKAAMGIGRNGDATIVLDLSLRTTLDIFSGTADPTAVYMNGDIKVEGAINDAFQLKNLIELVLEELE